MANMERFIEELTTFDDQLMSEATLAQVEPYLKKPSLEPESLLRKTSNEACASLCRWVAGVCRYRYLFSSSSQFAFLVFSLKPRCCNFITCAC